MDWMKSGNDNNFSVTVSKAGRGVAELLVDPISQGFKNDDGSVKTDGLEKTDDFKIGKFKKYNDCKKSGGFKNDDGSDLRSRDELQS